MTYSSAERHRVKEGVALGAATLGTGALLAASKSKSYYLEIAYREHDVPKSLTLRLHKDEWERFLQVARAETGKPVDFDAGEAPPARRGAAAPTAANAPAADGVAGLIALCQKGMVGLTLTGLDDGAAFKVDAVNSSTLPLRITLPKGDATVKLPQDLGTLTLTSPEERTLTLDPRGTVSFTLAQTGPQRVVKGSVTMRPVRGGMAMSMSSWSVRIEPTGSGKQQ